MRLGIDLDGVVADFNAGWMGLHGAEFGSRLTPDMVTSWDGLHDLGGFDDMAGFWKWARGDGHRPSIFRHLTPYPGAIESLHDLVARGHRIVVVTTKPRWARADTLHWLVDHDVPSDEVHIVNRKHEVACDVYLDDAPHVLGGLVRHRPTAVVCRFVRPWNDPIAGAIDVHSWDDFQDVVDGLE